MGNYEINKLNRDHMRGCINNDYEMQWNDSELMDLLLGHLPKIKNTVHDNAVLPEIHTLKKLLDLYKYTNDPSKAKEYEEKVEEAVKSIRAKQERWYGFNMESFRHFMELQPFCVISGYGGIGKSYFVFQMEKQLEAEAIPHLCIYGKYQKTVGDICFEEIIETAKNHGFVCVVDAINEMDFGTQDELIEILAELKKSEGIRIIVTYRTHKLRSETERKLIDLASSCYVFSGVSYESALSEMLKQKIRDVYKYEDILFTNNPLYLQALCKALSCKGIECEELNGFSTLTHILETYIKTILDKEAWNNTKVVFEWMYSNRKRSITRAEVADIIFNPDEYLFKMEEYHFLIRYDLEETDRYYSQVDSLTDFLFARFFVREIRGRSQEEQINTIRQRRRDFYGMDEVFIVSLFDAFDDYEKVGILLRESGLIESFTPECLCHIRFSSERIESFQNKFHIQTIAQLIQCVGGYSNKPFNCQNYLNSYYMSDSSRQLMELSRDLSGTLVAGRVKERLKNHLYYISLSGNVYSDEIFWFSLWCTASPNQEIRCIARKLLFETVRIKPTYIELLVNNWDRINDYYIQDAIVHVLSLLRPIQKGTLIDVFLLNRMNDPDFCLAKSLKRIGIALGDPYSYIRAEKASMLLECKNPQIDETLQSLFWRLDLYEKYLLPFRYWGQGRIDGISHFLSAPKKNVGEWNDMLEEKFSCVKEGDCNGSPSIESFIMEYYAPDFELDCISDELVLASFGRCLEITAEEYGIDVFSSTQKTEQAFLNSVFRKVADIAVDRFYGSIMCSHYTDGFRTYNNTQNSIGYEVYDPLEFDDEEERLATPVPTYSSEIEQIGNCSLSHIRTEAVYDEAWSKDAEKSINNIKLLLEPVSFHGRQWVLLNASIRLSEPGHTETYDIRCCTNPDVHLQGVYEDRYLTIELSEWKQLHEEYRYCKDRPWLSKSVPSIMGTKDWFDETNLVFPPARIVSELKLSYSIPDMAWMDLNGEAIILCDNNKNDYFKNNMSQAVYMRKDKYDAFVAGAQIHFFCFTEKMLDGRGYTDEASIHIEIANGEVVNRFSNSDEQRKYASLRSNCELCPYGIEDSQKSQTEIVDELMELIKKWNIQDGESD